MLAYCLLAAALLAVVSLGTGLARRDVAVLLKPRLLLRVVAAVVAAFALWLAGALLERQLGATPVTQLVAGLARLPLYLLTLGYGPGVGLVAGALFAGLQAGGGAPGWHTALLALELAVLGWLAIYPSPRSGRWAGPFDAVLAYALAWGTGGLALLEARHGTVTPAAIWAQQRPLVLGIGATALLLTLVPPAAYRRAFPHSRIAPPPPPAAADEGAPEGAPDGARGEARDPMRLTYPDLPRALSRGRSRRELDPYPQLHNDNDGD